MYVRLKFPYADGKTNYMVLQDFQFSRNSQFDSLHLSNIFSQKTKLLMILGSLVTFTLSGTLYVKNNGSMYTVDGIYDYDFSLKTYFSLPHLMGYLTLLTDGWNNGQNNLNSKLFAIEYVNSATEGSPVFSENFFPESFSFSITNKDIFIINISLSGRIGEAM